MRNISRNRSVILVVVLAIIASLFWVRAAEAKQFTPYQRWAITKCSQERFVFHHPYKGTVVADPPHIWCVWVVQAAKQDHVKAGLAANPTLAGVVELESGFNPQAQNPISTAYGMFQFLDGTWGRYGCYKTSDPVAQMRCGLRYIRLRYHTPNAALAFHKQHNWY